MGAAALSPGPFPLATRLWGVGVIQQHNVILNLQVHVSLIQWTLAYPATMRPDRGQISEIAGYVNHHANSVYNVSLLALLFFSCHVHHWSKQTSYFGLFKLWTVEVLASLGVQQSSTSYFAPCGAWALECIEIETG